MKTFILSLLVLAAPIAARAQSDADAKPSGLGIGLMGGVPTGAAFKYWRTDSQAVDAGLGVDGGGNFECSVDYLLHGWNLFPQPPDGRLAGYAGLGGRVDTGGASQGFGFRVPVGILFMPRRFPLEVFAEVAPVFVITNDAGAAIEGAVGFRYYFSVLGPQ